MKRGPQARARWREPAASTHALPGPEDSSGPVHGRRRRPPRTTRARTSPLQTSSSFASV